MANTQLLSGRYDIGALIGTGGMAEVRHARDTRLGRDVAIKFLREDLARDTSFHARFEREAQAAASLNHPAVVAVYDTGQEEGRPYIVMEHVRGETLRELLDREGHLPVERAAEIVANVLRALDYSHRHGIVHRDIKPGNVMVTRAGDVKVMDFGIARALTASTAAMTQTAAILGTANYLSPEQAQGEHVDARSDIYSTGCLLYELLTGAPPFTGDSAVAVAYQHVREDPLPPSALEPGVTPAMDAIVLMAMAKNPANRYQTAGDFRQDLDRAVHGGPVTARAITAAPLPLSTAGTAPAVLLAGGHGRQPRHGVAYLLLALGTIAVFVAAAFIARSLIPARSNPDVNTPNVMNDTLAQAEQALHKAGLDFTVQRKHSQHRSGTIIGQSPTSGILLSKGQSVVLTVSLGVQMVHVPQLQGLTEAAARTALGDSQLKVGKISYSDSTAPAGSVLSSNPSSSTPIPVGSSVALVLSKGDVSIANVVGSDPTTAQAVLHEEGLTSTVVVTYDASQPFDVVVTQNPPQGTLVAKGTNVTLTVNQPPAQSPTPSPTAAASNSPTPNPSASASVSPLPSPSGRVSTSPSASPPR